MWQLWSLCCLLAVVAGDTSCPGPEGDESWDNEVVLSSADLYLYAKFRSKLTYVRETDDGKVHDVKLNTDVMCVVRNKKNVVVPVHINITESRKGSLENKEHSCINYHHDIRFDAPVFVMVESRGEDEFGFDTVHHQGPYFYKDQLDEMKLMGGCENLDVQAAVGGESLTCPITRASESSCTELTEVPEQPSSNSTSSTLLPLSRATLAGGVLVLFRGIV